MYTRAQTCTFSCTNCHTRHTIFRIFSSLFSPKQAYFEGLFSYVKKIVHNLCYVVTQKLFFKEKLINFLWPSFVEISCFLGTFSNVELIWCANEQKSARRKSKRARHWLHQQRRTVASALPDFSHLKRGLEIIRSAVDLLHAVGTLYNTATLRSALTSTSWGRASRGSQKKIR